VWDDNYVPDRGKVLGAAELEEIEKFNRYADQDGDGICYRSLPGIHPKGAYFTRGSGHNEAAQYTEDSDEYRQVLDRLNLKSSTAANLVPAPDILSAGESTALGLISLGSCDSAVREALSLLSGDGIAIDYLRIRGFPFSSAISDFLDQHDIVFVVEQNRDAQLKTLLLTETSAIKEKLRSILEYNGIPIDCRNIRRRVCEFVNRNEAA